ncbi:MAG: protein translocase subunit SecD [Candidatus Wildermuthbacteria bacterium]|nr:protein translocase subunit SecD [Candidatus Wildermuthbacteria bacterium]
MPALTKSLFVLLFLVLLGAFCAAFAFPQYVRVPGFPAVPFKLGLDLQGGIHLVYQADLSSVLSAETDNVMNGLRDRIERRVNLFGISEPSIQLQGNGETRRLIVELAGIESSEQAIDLIGQTPYLEFKEYKTNYQDILAQNQRVFDGEEGSLEDPFQPTGLTGGFLKRADVELDSVTQVPQIGLRFNEEGAKLFEDITERNIGKPLAIFLDGAVLQAPVVQDKISGGQAQITGQFTVEEVRKIVRNLNDGALPVPISLVSQEKVGAGLGSASLNQSLRAGLIGFAAILVFMIFVYRIPGLMASLALLLYVVILLAAFKMIPVTLTLAGIAGFILSIGMAVDANVLIFARTKEELRAGSQIGAALEDGFRRAWPSIRDSNITTLMVALVLFWFGTSFVKGFAFTLSLGIVVSMFSAIVATRTFLRLLLETPMKKIPWVWK